MKWGITFILVILSADLSAQNIITNCEGDGMRAFAKHHMQKLDITDITLVISCNARMVDKELNATVVRNGESDYSLYIFSKDNMQKLIVHELIHIQQYELGKLIDVDNSTVLYNDIKYSLSGTPYLRRPWELEAISKAERLLHSSAFGN